MATALHEMTNARGKHAAIEQRDLSAKFEAISRVQGIIEFELDGTIITANENFLRLTEYSLEELRGAKHSQLVSPEYARSDEYDQFWRILQSGQFHSGMFPRVNKSGGTFWINASYIPVLDDNGKAYKVIKFATDGTEQYRQKLDNIRLQEAVDGATVNVVMCDENQVIVYINPAARRMFAKRTDAFKDLDPHFQPDGLVGQSIRIFQNETTLNPDVLRDRTKLPHQSEITLKNCVLGITATAITDADNNYMGNMIEWTDITDQRRAESDIKSLVNAASSGDFSTRLEAQAYEGFFRELSENLNLVMEATESSLGEVVSMMKALAEGRLDRPIQGDFNGLFADLQSASNQTLSALRSGFSDVSRVLNSLAKGDLSDRIDAEHPGLFAQLKTDANQTVEDFRSAITRIRKITESITVSAGEISQGNTHLSQRTEEQASSLQETASSMEEMTSTVRSSADNARQANQLAAGAREQAESGGKVIKQAVKAMAAINESSEQIADIITVIDEIAFQTNLLALNAAVEAARAGEQGRGFAVVATEVRNLSQRSASAAKQIKELIKDSTQKVRDGSKLVDESGEALTQIVTGANRVSDIISEISAAAQEQSSGIEQVNKAVTQLDEVTQQNAALVEQSAAASKSMDQQAKALTELLQGFKLRSGAAPQRPVRLESARPEALMPEKASARTRTAPTNPAHSARPEAQFAKPAPVDTDDWEEF